jgi:hypothetical protein
MKVTVIGNGPSRGPIPLEKIPTITIGCNDIFETFYPDALCIVDHRMMEMVYDSGYPNPVYHRFRKKNENTKTRSNWYTPGHIQHHSSGNGAISIAVNEYKATEIDLLGFDIGPGRVGRLEYFPDASFNLWGKYICWLMKYQTDIKWRRVVDRKSKVIPEMPTISVEEYIKELDK